MKNFSSLRLLKDSQTTDLDEEIHNQKLINIDS